MNILVRQCCDIELITHRSVLLVSHLKKLFKGINKKVQKQKPLSNGIIKYLIVKL